MERASSDAGAAGSFFSGKHRKERIGGAKAAPSVVAARNSLHQSSGLRGTPDAIAASRLFCLRSPSVSSADSFPLGEAYAPGGFCRGGSPRRGLCPRQSVPSRVGEPGAVFMLGGQRGGAAYPGSL